MKEEKDRISDVSIFIKILWQDDEVPLLFAQDRRIEGLISNQILKLLRWLGMKKVDKFWILGTARGASPEGFNRP
jgi:hypothetical protein